MTSFWEDFAAAEEEVERRFGQKNLHPKRRPIPSNKLRGKTRRQQTTLLGRIHRSIRRVAQETDALSLKKPSGPGTKDLDGLFRPIYRRRTTQQIRSAAPPRRILRF